MERRRSLGSLRGTRGPLLPALVGALTGALILGMIVLPASHPVAGSGGAGAAPKIPAMVDPQFIPDILTSPYSALDGEFGISVAISGSTVAVGAPHESVTVYDVGTTYGQVDLLNTASGATGVINGPTVSACQFGYSVAMTPTRIVVGAPGYDGEGSVYVYNYTTVVQANHSVIVSTLVSTLYSPDPDTAGPGSEFGQSVGISGNLVVVGAPEENATGFTESGDAYIFNLHTGTTILLSSPSPQTGGEFGESVAINGNRLVVGAPEEVNSTATPVGHAYVFDASTGDLVTTLTSPHPLTNGFFGGSVAVNGSTVVIGEPYGGPSGPSYQAGAAYEFGLVNDTNSTFTSPAPVRYGEFGTSVAINSATIVVGAGGEASNGNAGAGNAYLFSAISGTLITSYFEAPEWPAHGFFGGSVAENGSDGVIVGAPYERADNDPQAGHAFFFHQIPLTLASPNPISPPQFYYGGRFGESVAADNGMTLVGAPNETGPGDAVNGGNAYLLRSSMGPVTRLSPEYVQAYGFFGTSVALWGKLAVVGAPGQTTGGAGDGAVYIFNSTTGALLAMLVSPSPSAGGQFGYSVATNGTAVVVGAPGENGGAGNAYVFHSAKHYSGVVWVTYWASLQLNTTDPSREPSSTNGEFGWSVAINGSTVVVGAPGENSSTGDVPAAGNVYVFDAGNGTLVFSRASPHPQTTGGPYANEGFGYSVAVATGTIVVGSPNETALGLPGEGIAYVLSETNGSLLHTLTSPNAVGAGGGFGWAVAVNAGIIGVSALYEPAFGVPAAGNVYFFNPATGAVVNRYNSPVPTSGSLFGDSICIGHGGTIVVGQPGFVGRNAYGPGLAYEFFL